MYYFEYRHIVEFYIDFRISINKIKDNFKLEVAVDLVLEIQNILFQVKIIWLTRDDIYVRAISS